MDDVKITMLGTTGAGKTCYMLGMYALMQMGFHGFTLSAKDMDEDLRLTDLWERLIDSEGEERWPPPTANEPHTYAFNFSYALRPLLGFDWLDYRGGAMRDASTETDAQELKNSLLESSCVFLCVSGEYLREKVSDIQLNSKAKRAGVNRMNQYLAMLGETKQISNQKPFSVVITITKYDQCVHRPRQELLEDIKKMFGPLFVTNSGWLVMLCPVSLGKELAENSNGGQIDPKNMHLPLIFALYSKFRESFLAEQNRVSNVRETLANLRRGNWFERLLKENDIRAKETSIEALQNQIDEVQQKMALLAQELSSAQLYLSGQEIQVDV